MLEQAVEDLKYSSLVQAVANDGFQNKAARGILLCKFFFFFF